MLPVCLAPVPCQPHFLPREGPEDRPVAGSDLPVPSAGSEQALDKDLPSDSVAWGWGQVDVSICTMGTSHLRGHWLLLTDFITHVCSGPASPGHSVVTESQPSNSSTVIAALHDFCSLCVDGGLGEGVLPPGCRPSQGHAQ